MAMFAIQTYSKDLAEMSAIAFSDVWMMAGLIPGTSMMSPTELRRAPRNCGTEEAGRPAFMAALATPVGRFSGGVC